MFNGGTFVGAATGLNLISCALGRRAAAGLHTEGDKRGRIPHVTEITPPGELYLGLCQGTMVFYGLVCRHVLVLF